MPTKQDEEHNKIFIEVQVLETNIFGLPVAIVPSFAY